MEDLVLDFIQAVLVVLLWPLYLINRIQETGGKYKLTPRAETMATVMLCGLWWLGIGAIVLCL